MWFKCPNDGRHYNSENVVMFETAEGGDVYNVVFTVSNSSGSPITYNDADSAYPDQSTAEAALLAVLASFGSE